MPGHVDLDQDDFFLNGHERRVLSIVKTIVRQQLEAAKRQQAEAEKAVASLAGTISSRVSADLRVFARWRLAVPSRRLGSLRPIAPDTGGRSFHFKYTSISRDAGAPPPTEASNGRRGEGPASAHMRYIERPGALERASLLDPAGMGALSSNSSTSASQNYLENPEKLETSGGAPLQVGNIGDTAEERVQFWLKLEQAEPHPRAIIQHRIIAELPHDFTPADRLNVVREFCSEFEARGLPFWASLHAPTAKNDDRNYHVHIAFSDRPAAKLADGRWDFEHVESYVSDYKTRWRRALRQPKLREYSSKGAVRQQRARFSKVVNKVAERAGSRTRYDPRSYKDMRLEIEPMRSVRRRSRKHDGQSEDLLIDRDATQKDVAVALQRAALERLRSDREYFEALSEAIDIAEKAERRRERSQSADDAESIDFSSYRKAIAELRQSHGVAHGHGDYRVQAGEKVAPPSIQPRLEVGVGARADNPSPPPQKVKEKEEGIIDAVGAPEKPSVREKQERPKQAPSGASSARRKAIMARRAAKGAGIG